MLGISDSAGSGHSGSALDSCLARIPGWIAGVGGAGVLTCLLAAQARFAAGLGLGVLLALVGYWWLYRGIRAALDPDAAHRPAIVLLKLALRYPLMFGAVLLFDRTGWLPARALILGLFAPLAAVLIECSMLGVQGLRAALTAPKPSFPLR